MLALQTTTSARIYGSMCACMATCAHSEKEVERAADGVPVGVAFCHAHLKDGDYDVFEEVLDTKPTD